MASILNNSIAKDAIRLFGKSSSRLFCLRCERKYFLALANGTTSRRHLHESTISKHVPDFAFAFDIDGVLVRSSDPLPRAHKALSYLQSQRIPFILLTNGGGKHETERVEELSKKLEVPLDTSNFIQSHTPFADLNQYKEKTVMVVGGDEDKCRVVAERYGFKSVVTPGDILVAHPEIWPFSAHLIPSYKEHARALTRQICSNADESLRIDAIFVYNDPRDWGLDATIILDLLLSRKGILGTISSKNNDKTLPNRGYQQDSQPPLYFSNPDLWWAAKYHLPRLGQGGFREAMEGLWTAITGGREKGVELKKEIIGKPYFKTYEFAEKILNRYREELFHGQAPGKLSRVFMVGDNPESDIRGANNFESPLGTEWFSILVKTGVYEEGEPPSCEPKAIVGDVLDAVQFAVDKSGWRDIDKSDE
ncbi:HAD-superfamily hydrolase [Patellaria atrata CBS 101060]|uniref:HAD-superfamily hydrolase n=1 Tax=Patellaria atrata CBS 101060 TaxID=1346257 RepID=A0A9P4SAE7_9PEZI|nr:HAD-superfamily hydrolase [Patellaria atrata CBS 101060]